VALQSPAPFASSASSLSTVVTFQFASSDPCVGQPNGTTCDDGNACTQNTTCTGGVCGGGTTTTCTALDQCHDVGVCNPLNGVCSNPAKTNGTTCNADSSGCTQGDSCQAGTCTAGPVPACTTPPDAQCQNAAGVCVSDSSTTFPCA